MASQPAAPTVTPTQPSRLGSIDAYRGLVMLLMMAEVLRLPQVAKAVGSSRLWDFLAFHQSHVAWAGCSLHDLIQPSFSFLVGVSLPFSIASREARGQSRVAMIAHAVWRAVVLVLLGVFLRSMGRPQTNWTFEDTLSQIGFGYVPLFLLGFTRQRWQWAALVVILVGYWGAFALYPLPPADFQYADVGVPADWPYHYAGLAAHWNKNSNLAWEFDTWFLNLFPRAEAFVANRGGYATLSFIPTLGTMILGLIAGGWLFGEQARRLPYRQMAPRTDVTRKLATAATPSFAWRTIACLVMTGTALLVLGLLAHGAVHIPYVQGLEDVSLVPVCVCPCVKRIWTPSWTLYSGGWCFFFLAGFYAVIDAWRLTAWSFPLRVIGANSIAAYLLAHGPDKFIADSLTTHLPDAWFAAFGAAYQPLILGGMVLLLEWLVLYWLYKQRIHIRI